YDWELVAGTLRLLPVEEPCARRRLLLTTRTLSTFAACPPANMVSIAGSPVSDATDAPRGAFARATPAARAGADADIDTLLKQMSDCWATRQPDRFLQLLSQEFRDSQSPEDDDDRRRFALSMGAPIVWDLVNDVEMRDATHATATVRQTLGDNIDTLRYAFVFEDGAWRWDGIADSP
ncbi:MAG: hypothetical protein H0T18_03170, partial [Chloroflexia bacterium]|nr:hypothetical protein [Chloroflexia bacterium]